MPTNAGTDRTIIVGAGVIGVCAAHYLAKRNIPVTLLDAGEVGGACSFGSAGLISFGHLPIPRPGVIKQTLKWMFDSESPLYISPRFDPALINWLWRFRAACNKQKLEENMRALCDLYRASLGLFEELLDETEGAFFYESHGYMEVFRTEKALKTCCQQAEISRRFGFDFQPLAHDELLAREPALSPECVGAVYWPQSAFCNPYDFVRAVAALAQKNGADVRENKKVVRIKTRESRTTGVELEGGEHLECAHLIIAAGAWTPALVRALNIKIPMQPAKGYHRDIPHSDPPLTTACFLGEQNMVCTPMNSFMRLAGTLEFSGLNDSMRPKRLEMLTRGARKYLVNVNDSPPSSEWMGLRPCTPDGLPIIGAAPGFGNVLIATGHAMLGLTQGPATGKVLAEKIAGEELSVDLGAMGVGRFSGDSCF